MRKFFVVRKILLILTFFILISSCCTTPSYTPFSMSDEEIIHQGEEAIIYSLSLCLNLDVCEKERIIRFKKEIIKNHSDWSEKAKIAILKGEIFLGMRKKQVLASWGEPKRRVKTITKDKVQEQLIYNKDRNLYFEDEILIAVEDLESL